MAEKFPEMPQSHIVGQRALDVFQYLRPQEWIVTPSIRDYGWDGVVEIGTRGLFFFLQPPTSNPNTTFALSISAFLYYNYEGVRRQGLGHYLKHFMGPLPWLAPLMFPIEIIGNLARILSLGMRLFGNIFGEHTATGIFMGLVPFVVPWPMMGLGIFGAFLQTFVFIMLTMVYIGGAIAAEEH